MATGDAIGYKDRIGDDNGNGNGIGNENDIGGGHCAGKRQWQLVVSMVMAKVVGAS